MAHSSPTSGPRLYQDSRGRERFVVGAHGDIPSPVFIPEVKGAEGLQALLNHVSVLDEQNPVMVPAARWSALREKNEIINRTSDNEDVSGREEISSLEQDHPIVFYDPPELYNYKRTKTLVNYLFKIKNLNKKRFEGKLRNGDIDSALDQLPAFMRPFIAVNINRVLEETSGASLVEPVSDDTVDAWNSLSRRDYGDYFQILADAAISRPSSAVIPPVPKMAREWNPSLVTSWCTANAEMLKKTAADAATGTFFHLYLDPRALRTQGNDTAGKCLKIIDRELIEHDYDGVALTVFKPNKIWQMNKAARMETFVTNLSQIADEHALPIISPRSEWFGSFITDLGVQGFSALMNGAWSYSRSSSKGGPTGSDKYGQTVIPTEARALKLQSKSGDDIEGYLQANGSVPSISGLPSTPPTYNPSGTSVKDKFGTSPEYRKTFGKPLRLAHTEEAREFRREKAKGISNPAREYLKNSDNPYVDV